VTASPLPAPRDAGIALRAIEIRTRRRAPDIGLARDPGLRPLRRVLVPGPRLEIAELLVFHLIELAEQFDHLIVRIAVIGGDVVPGHRGAAVPR
jgi:hypothetical protein